MRHFWQPGRRTRCHGRTSRRGTPGLAGRLATPEEPSPPKIGLAVRGTPSGPGARVWTRAFRPLVCHHTMASPNKAHAMTHTQVVGLLVVILAGLSIGLAPLPLKRMRRFQYEQWAFVAMLAGLIVAPWAVTLL